MDIFWGDYSTYSNNLLSLYHVILSLQQNDAQGRFYFYYDFIDEETAPQRG